MEFRCKPEKIEETLKKARELFEPQKVVMAKATWDAMFDVQRDRRTGKALGDDRKHEFSGVPVEFLDSAGPNAIVVAGETPIAETNEDHKKKTKK